MELKEVSNRREFFDGFGNLSGKFNGNLNRIGRLTCITQKFDDGTIWSPTVSINMKRRFGKNSCNFHSFSFLVFFSLRNFPSTKK
jgi:hypothetical protein